MKKLFFGALCAMMLVGCSSRESMIKDYEKACNDGNAVKAIQIAADMEKKYDKGEFTDEEVARIAAASLVLEAKTLENMSGVLGGASNALEGATKAMGALEELGKELEDAE